MANELSVPREIEGRGLYIDGYFSERTWSGERPDYGYPRNHVPATTIPNMKVETGYMAALKSPKK